MSPIMSHPLSARAQAEITKPIKLVTQVTWGRRAKAQWADNISSTIIVALSPVWMHTNWIALEYFNGSLPAAIKELYSTGLIKFAQTYFPRPALLVFVWYAAWLLWQAILYIVGPGTKTFGQRTPGGHLLQYTANGFFAWSITHLAFAVAVCTGFLDPAILATHWEPLLVATNSYGFFIAIVAQWKGYWAPSFPEDRKMSGSWVFDYFSGVELNPRIGHLDFKFFHNGRPGIGAWTLINFCWLAYQYQRLGYVTHSMIIVNILQAIYVIDFYWNEAWYTRTVDIAHDHFGFYLAWGTTSFLPQFYTLQAQYLARYPTYLTPYQASAWLGIGLAGYALFRSANYQKDIVRAQNGDAVVWGRPAGYMKCTYRTSDGKEHSSILLTCGWWGVCRHANYLADLIQTLAMCAVCGFHDLLPWSHFVFMVVLLGHRLIRDERRCRNKYGEQWDAYCEKVPYRLVPGVW